MTAEGIKTFYKRVIFVLIISLCTAASTIAGNFDVGVIDAATVLAKKDCLRHRYFCDGNQRYSRCLQEKINDYISRAKVTEDGSIVFPPKPPPPEKTLSSEEERRQNGGIHPLTVFGLYLLWQSGR